MSPGAVAGAPCKAGPFEVDEPLRTLEAELESPMGRVDRVEEACRLLGALKETWEAAVRAGRFASLAALAARHAGPSVRPAVALLLDVAEAADPALLDPLLASPAPAVAHAALERAVRMSAAGLLDEARTFPRLAPQLAALVETPGSPLASRESLERIALLFGGAGRAEGQARLDSLFSDAEDSRLRRLAARLLDLTQGLPSEERTGRTLGDDAARFLAPYLQFTRATHLDLLDLSPISGEPPACLPSLRRAEAVCGEALLREILSAFGWRRLNVGLEVHPFVGIAWGDSFPLLLTPAEGRLLDGDPRARKLFERWIVVAHGGAAARRKVAATGADPVDRFRGLNLLHADALGEILDLAPLTADKARRILARIGRIVEEFCGLFAEKEPDECRVVADVHRDLQERIEREAGAALPGRSLSAEATRLVQLFEDPGTAGEVRTLHGMKRYLHQKGLKLGFRLAEMGRGTDRTVDVAIVDDGRLGPVVQAVEYVDFEEEPATAGPSGIPWPVRVAVDGLSRQLLFGQQRLPKVKAFCYGNEVHYYLAYRNHPLFLRVDFAPPLRGGMLDLEYYGVSKHELDSHPNPSLDGVGRFFRRLDIEVGIENTRIHARYDKERAADLSDLCEKVEALFRLAPYLMDIDWTIGDLALDAGARARVGEAWADFFARWGVLPFPQLLTSDRVGILAAVEAGPSGPREARWDGRGPYRDRFAAVPGAELWKALSEALRRRGLPSLPEEEGPASQIELERELLRPLREGIARGEWRLTPEGLEPSPPGFFERRHETELFAGLLVAGGPRVAGSARVARFASALERHLRFETTGSVNGFEVQRASLPLRGEAITLFGLRDGAGVLRLAFFTLDGPPYRRFSAPGEPWQDSATLDTEVLGARLRRNNFPVSCDDSTGPEEAEALRLSFFTPNPREEPPHLPGERIVRGIAAAPGVATGLASLGAGGRRPADVDGAILIAASLRPEDGPLLLGAAGVVSTGGGVLSHAGLLAMQFGKPALVTGGRWDEAPGVAPTVVCRRTEFEEAVTLDRPLRVLERRARREIEERVREGDLLVVDADAGLLRLLGQDRDALALHEGLRQLLSATRTLATATADDEVLALRGRRLRALHQLERLFDRMEDPVLARHAARELLTGGGAGLTGDPASLLRRLLANRSVGEAAREACRRIAADLDRRHAAVAAEAVRLVPASADPLEILFLRRDVRRLEKRLGAVDSCLAASGAREAEAPSAERFSAWFNLEGRALSRLTGLRADLAGRIAAAPAGERGFRHRLSLLQRLDAVVATPAPAREPLEAHRRRVEEEDRAAVGRLAGRRLVTAADGGAELRPLAGSKAAFLAEIDRLGAGATIPAWFAVTDRAFHEVLDSPAPQAAQLTGAGAGLSLRSVIALLLADSARSPETTSGLIRRAWELTPLPPGLAAEVAEAYGLLDGKPDPFVAIRSSAFEEDTEKAARAGEFDTFLFVRGAPAVLDHLRLAWAGLWTPRAIRNRESLGGGEEAVGGGVLVQRMVDARASGVLHTVNVASGRIREMLINAGLGLGEGVVSGLVAADEITVEKDEALAGEEIHVRYLTRDKRERVVFDAGSGSGTRRVETLYHQRLRPALEYVELCQLVHTAARLEETLGLPLDVEFAVDPAGLHLLQVRPVPAAVAVWRETVECIPFQHGGPP